jgi:hypothetical protein
MITPALVRLMNGNFIERVPGTQKHYQITTGALAVIF